ncbi:MAG TPA: XdhC family protein [Pyrinomonadaceae bacterium]|nr:XdhC family protein [Pyrinomonadaceae bacterium]
MKEIELILKTIPKLNPGEKAIVATVVDVQGSAYRGEGAKMLIRANGDAVGTVSGGCLEADVLERAKQVADSGKAQVFTYDTTKNEDSVFSLNMGCRGVIRILFEPLDHDYFDRLSRARGGRKRFVNKVVVEGDNIGARTYFGDGDHGDRSHADGDGFVEIIDPPPSLFISGAGADAIPVCSIAKTLGWLVTVVDHRAAFASGDRFPDADSVRVLHPDAYEGELHLDDHAVAVVMTHNYEKDKLIENFLLKTNAAYIGQLGPRKRTEKLLAEIGESWPSNLHAPVGLDIGSESPEEIALAIVSEVLTVLRKREGGFLTSRGSK